MNTTVQKLAAVFGVVFILVAIIGFIAPGGMAMQPADPATAAKALGIFPVNLLHNIVHLLFGIVGLVFAKTAAGARTYLVGGGAVYLVLWIVGLAGAAGWIPANTADNWLHFGLGVGMIALGLVTSRATARTATA